MRVLTQVAYRPALLYIDSPKYLAAGLERYDPQGYRLFVLKPLLAVGNLAVVAGFQHLLGLAMATLLYLVLLRRHAPRWAAALATGPLLLDAYQLQMEQTIMPDVTFEALITTGLAILLWNTRPSMPAVALAGFVLGLSATIRQVGEVLVIPAVVFCLLAARGRRYRLAAGGLLTVSFAIPVLVYMTYSAVILHDRFELSDQGDGVLYGRVAAVADCAALRVPAAERAVCPAPRIAASFGVDGLVNNRTSPAYIAPLPTGISHATATKRFSSAVLEQQPLRVAGAIARDAVKLFALTRDTSPGDTPISRWQFQTAYPVYPDTTTLPSAAALFQGTGGALRRWTDRWPPCCAATSCMAGTRRGLSCCCHCWPGWAVWPPAAASAGPGWPACWSPGRASWCCWAPTSTSSPGVTSSPPWSRSRSRARSGPVSCRPGSAAAPGGAPPGGGPPPAPQIRQ